jgi:UDP-2,3-diacylglucosamine hydrolase
MTGNRDFLLGRRFIAGAGCSALSDPSGVIIYNKPIVLAHGDKLCTDDRLHQWFRLITGWNWVQKLFCWLPLSSRRFIASKLRRVSKRHHDKLAKDSLDASDDAVKELLDKYNSQLLIHGHTHIPDVHYHELDGISGKRLVMGAWHDNADVVKLYADGESELVPVKSLIE